MLADGDVAPKLKDKLNAEDMERARNFRLVVSFAAFALLVAVTASARLILAWAWASSCVMAAGAAPRAAPATP